MNKTCIFKINFYIFFGVFLLSLCPLHSSGQFWKKKSDKEKKLNWRKKKAIADTLLKMGSYYSAINYYHRR